MTPECPLSCQQKLKIELGLSRRCLCTNLLSTGVNSMYTGDTHRILENVIPTETLPAGTERNRRSTKQKESIRIPKFCTEDTGWLNFSAVNATIHGKEC